MEAGAAEWAAVIGRLESLEKQNRRMKRIGASGLLLIGSLLLMGQASGKRTVTADAVEAKSFVVKDEEGRTRAVLQAIGPEQAELVLYGYLGVGRGMDREIELTTYGTCPNVSVDVSQQSLAELSVCGKHPALEFFRRIPGGTRRDLRLDDKGLNW